MNLFAGLAFHPGPEWKSSSELPNSQRMSKPSSATYLCALIPACNVASFQVYRGNIDASRRTAPTGAAHIAKIMILQIVIILSLCFA